LIAAVNSKLIIVSLSLVTLLLVGGIALASRPSKSNPALDTFAKCLSEKKFTMYGAYWCPHCQAQKKLFGDSFQYVPNVECTQQVDLCLEKKIEGYPTWIASDGARFSGQLTLEKISEITQCQL
jgi:thiol-disulfide isomerase/thioredoxin